MALDIQKLETAHAAKGNKLWTYDGSADTKAAIKGAGFFNAASGLLAVNDRLMIAASDANFDAHISANAAGVVTIAAVDAFV